MHNLCVLILYLHYFNIGVKKEMTNYLVDDIILYCNASRKNAFCLREEVISYCDLTFVFKGELKYIADGTTYVLKKNDAMFLPAGTSRFRFEATEFTKYVSFNFSLLPDVDLSLPRFMHNCVSNDIKRMLSFFPQTYILPHYHSKEKLTNILNCILYELLDFSAFHSNNEHIINIIKYIDAHVTEPLSLQSVSKEIGLSKEYTASIFKKEIGRTVTQFINDRKMYLAKDMIFHNDLNLAEVADYLGYDNYSYFSRLFKHYFGLSPQEFKSKNVSSTYLSNISYH